MNIKTITDNKSKPRTFQSVATQAASLIAPAWPLDRSIAVNPWWPQRHQTIDDTFAQQAVLTGFHGLMPVSYYRAHWQAQIQPHHLMEAKRQCQSPLDEQDLVAVIRGELGDIGRWKTLAMLMDDMVPSEQGHSWEQEIIQQVSQFIALYHQYPERFDAEGGKSGQHLYQSWLEVVCLDKGIKTLLGVDLLDYFNRLPKTLSALFEHVEHQWQDVWYDEQGALTFTRGSLNQLSGWAGWQAWLDWQSGLEQKTTDEPHALGLVAILLAWDTVLMHWLLKNNTEAALKIRQRIKHQSMQLESLVSSAKQVLEPLWVWQCALEISIQDDWVTKIKQTSIEPLSELPELQAIFCIDVRSEPMRRAIEAQKQGFETLGFAGFFGVPVSYQTQDGNVTRPQLPGLLAPNFVAKSTRVQPERWFRMTHLGWQNSFEKPASNLGMVEAGGLLKLVSLFKRAVLEQGTDNPVNKEARKNQRWQLERHDIALTVAEKAELGAGILKAIGISQRLAKVILLTGHGSQTCNNHTASGLDCGACGGQTGEVNVKVLAALLNDKAVREKMAEFGVLVPEQTVFYAALHNTTTDDIDVFEAPNQAAWLADIDNASQLARKNRSKQFADIDEPSPEEMVRFFKHRATNWAQMRPEWGLCNNAGVFIAPRHLTKNIDFSGRAFLHEYHVSQDPEFSQLEKIMTAPLLVMNWINLQYYASVTMPDKYGSGNKLLHNVVGGRIGVFEGNGGDLRIGLSHQSVHDGEKYRHQPVRLNAFIQAPKSAIEAILARHADVAALADNQWLFLYQIDEDHQVWRYHNKHWQLK
ncbi:MULTISPECIES: DUF2309 domain-containing protein [unclassified Vibrio]|uniref:Probable inorganic carbon transporter subunit DabA n=1 Tax=Vibrio sp. HB236076 TaxID=3232307 RepID=A0AB39H913_9VIBR|nr:DUF2309 domain-containing protein [Vibrio sp. HB161653]MDP5254249.1 DUF2309 domain-containing protein [Vibrio sp. HB161653]